MWSHNIISCHWAAATMAHSFECEKLNTSHTLGGIRNEISTIAKIFSPTRAACTIQKPRKKKSWSTWRHKSTKFIKKIRGVCHKQMCVGQRNHIRQNGNCSRAKIHQIEYSIWEFNKSEAKICGRTASTGAILHPAGASGSSSEWNSMRINAYSIWTNICFSFKNSIRALYTVVFALSPCEVNTNTDEASTRWHIPRRECFKIRARWQSMSNVSQCAGACRDSVVTADCQNCYMCATANNSHLKCVAGLDIRLGTDIEVRIVPYRCIVDVPWAMTFAVIHARKSNT